MKLMKRAGLLLLALALLFTLAACGIEVDGPTVEPTPEPTATASVPPTQEPSEGPSEGPSAEPSDEPVNTPDRVPHYRPVQIAVLSGPTGIGAAKLLSDADRGTGTLRADYRYNIYSDNTELVARLTTGETDIATMASNMAVNLYNKTGGDVTIIAGGTLGVLHILEGGGGTEINSVADLAGKTIYSAGRGANPEYILRHLLQKSGFEVVTDEEAVLDSTGEKVKIAFCDAGEIQAGLLNGSIQYAMLPVPAATAAIARNEGRVRDAIDVTEAWDELQGGQLVMTAVVARTQFVMEHPELVDAFLADYEASIDYVTHNPDAAAELVAGLGLTANEAIAKLAIPQCHLVFLSDNDMMSALSGYFKTLYDIDPASVGGSLPDDGIYYVR